MPNSNRIGIKTILSTSKNIREGVFVIKTMVTLIVILENLLINEVICLILIGTLHVLCDIDYNLVVISLLRYGKEEKYCITFDVLKVLIIVPIESKNDLVEATFYKSCLKQFNAEHTAFECDFLCYVMVKRRNTVSCLMPLKF